MLYWEWRRLFRQKWRNFRPIPDVNYGQYARKRLLVTFILFFVGWKMLGITLTEMLLHRPDDSTGEMRYFEPWEMKKIIHEKRVSLDKEKENTKPKFTLADLTKFPLDD
ncbi:hypothetical protein FO519_004494 [Halicephalobus sp. NKZ332]|nr:hypothetical protein FO519_004494 [Halicephalobus sp. NKZ332]